MDVTLIKSGRWGLSRPVQEADGGWTTYAEQQRLALGVENYPPPRVNGAPAVDAVLVRLVGPVTAPTDGNTRLFPRNLTDLADVTLGELTANQRTALRDTVEEWLPGYTYLDYQGVERIVASFLERASSTYTNDTTLKQVVRDIFKHLGHTISRPRAQLIESHNTEYLDDFSTDPFSEPRWVNDRGTHVWDSGNSELDCSLALSPFASRYNVNNPGSIEHESQATFLIFSTGGFASGGGGVRMDGGGGYFVVYDPDADQIRLRRSNTSFTENATLATYSSFTSAGNDFITQRLAASGAAGENVVLDLWYTNDGSSKPSDPGWFGDEGSPTQTYTDTAADRRDDAGHIYCGIMGGGTGGDSDTRHCHWKSQAISDRGGTPTIYTRTLSDSVSVVDSPVRGARYGRVTQDQFSLSDSLVRGQLHGRVLNDPLSVSDLLLRYAQLYRRTDDSVAVTDSLISQFFGVYQRVLIDSVTATDFLVVSQLHGRVLVDVVTVVDAIAKGQLHGRVTSDQIELLDLTTRYLRLYRQPADSVEVDDTLVKTLTQALLATIDILVALQHAHPIVMGLKTAQPIEVSLSNVPNKAGLV